MIPIPACVVCVAPAPGRARSVVDLGADVRAGDLVAVVDAPGRATRVEAPSAGRVGGVLVGAHETVSEGQGVVWLSR